MNRPDRRLDHQLDRLNAGVERRIEDFYSRYPLLATALTLALFVWVLYLYANAI